jgi:hypothetical protein
LTTKKLRKAEKAEEKSGGIEDLDPRLKRFEFNLNTLCAWEDAAGRNFGTFEPNSPKDLRLLIWAGLKTQLPEVTLEDAGAMITPKNTPALTALIEEKMGVGIGAMTL